MTAKKWNSSNLTPYSTLFGFQSIYLGGGDRLYTEAGKKLEKGRKIFWKKVQICFPKCVYEAATIWGAKEKEVGYTRRPI